MFALKGGDVTDRFITACQSSQQEHGRCMSPPLYITQEWIASVDISFYC